MSDFSKKILGRSAALFLLLELTGCYYPAYPSYPVYPDGGMPAPQQPGPGATPAQECREYTSSAAIEGKTQQIVGKACLQPDGTWKDINSGAPVSMPPAPAVAYAPAPAYPPPAYYPAPAYYAAPYPYPYAGPVVVDSGFYVGGGGGYYRHWR